MNALLKVAVYTLVFLPRFKNKPNSFFEKLEEEIPWILLPNVLTEITGNSLPWNFAKVSTGKTAWCEFPGKEVLVELKPKNISKEIEFYSPRKFDKKLFYNVCLSEFEEHNKNHCNLEELREGVIIEKSFSDCLKYFSFRNNEELEEFQRMGFLYLVERIYLRSGFLMTQDQIMKNIKYSLLDTYSKEIESYAEKTLTMLEETNDRINRYDFYNVNQEVANFYDKLVRLTERRIAREEIW